jgi:methionyl-tRNA formyltransferase|tara:strand:- start:88 stop:741 length:654 start_codon:yes stop_codon:yes gene_type:complete
MKYLIITKKIWNKKNFVNLGKKIVIKKNLNLKFIKKMSPKIIFFIHWSKMISPDIYNKFLCIQFHSSDLPKFRGGSPIQNQILRGIKKTKISAFKLNSNLDSGSICIKKNLNLNGSASKIYVSMEKKSVQMIKQIICMKKINFKPQKGKPSIFKRLQKKDSEIKKNKIKSINDFYNIIRMLDAKGYPSANIKFKKFKINFLNVKKNIKILYGKFKIQ